MARQTIIYIIILLVGLAGGTGIGFLMTQQKINTANATIDELNDQQAQIEADFKAVNTKLSRLEGELTRSRNDVMRKNDEMNRAQIELGRMKKVLDQALKGQGTTTAAQPSRTTTPTISTAGAKEYTIKDGDSLWKIAANELGNGIRYEEILKLNPGMTKDSRLTIGDKIKIPAK